MKGIDKPYRLAIYNALNGNISYNGANIPFYDELKSGVDSGVQLFALFSTQQTNLDQNFDAFIHNCSIDIEIVTKFAASVTKDVLDDIEEAITTILFPDPHTFGIVQPAGLQIQSAYVSQTITITTAISPTESILRKIIKISSIITQS